MAFSIGYHTASARKKRRLEEDSVPAPLPLKQQGTLVPSEVEKAVHLHKNKSERIVAKLNEEEEGREPYSPEIRGCVFTGHTKNGYGLVGVSDRVRESVRRSCR